MLTLTGCSTLKGVGSNKDKSVAITNKSQVTKPKAPARPVMRDEKFYVCPDGNNDYVCLTPQSAENVIKNKAEVGKWMDSAENIIDYYHNHPNLN